MTLPLFDLPSREEALSPDNSTCRSVAVPGGVPGKGSTARDVTGREREACATSSASPSRLAAVNGSERAPCGPVRVRTCAGGCGTIIPDTLRRLYCSDRCRLLAWAKRQAESGKQRALPGESRVERAFREWVSSPDGQTVEREVIGRARLLLARGRRRYGIAALVEAIRYDWSVRLDGEPGGPRLNNSHRSLLARKVMSEQSDLDGFFETRELRGVA